jgi:hypothetical protein
MNKTVTAVFDGQVLRPDSPLDLEPNERYVITIGDVSAPPSDGDVWKVLDSLTGTVEAPSDWASEHDHYLYGSPKRNRRNTK